MANLLPLSLMALTCASVGAADNTNNALAGTNFKQNIRHSGYRFVPPSAATANIHSGPTADDETFELLDIVLMASVDGKFHAMNRTSGQTVWSMSSSSTPSASANPPISGLEPLVRTTHPDRSADSSEHDSSSSHRPQEFYIIEPQSGEIYIMSPSSSPSAPLQAFPYTMPQLVDMSPFVFTTEDESRTFIGSKQTSLLVIQLETGKVRTISAECPWDPDPWEDFNDDVAEIDLDELEDVDSDSSSRRSRRAPKPTEVYIGRTDYHISIYTKPLPSSSRSPPLPVQNLTFSVYGPNNQDHALQATYIRSKDNQYIQSMPGGEILSFRVKGRPKEAATDATDEKESEPLWGYTFREPIVAVFDILTRSDPHQSAFALLQPRPRLADVLAFNALLGKSQRRGPADSVPGLPQEILDALPNIDSAYVGIVKETGSLYAMSPERFPLVAFGPSKNHATPPVRLIGGSAGDYPEDSSDDDPMDVDAITRARKMRERLQREHDRCWSPEDSSKTSWDRTCLTGIHVLETGSSLDRARRLLGGAPGVELNPGPVSGTPRPSAGTEPGPNGTGMDVITEHSDSDTNTLPQGNSTSSPWWMWSAFDRVGTGAGGATIGSPGTLSFGPVQPVDFLFALLLGAIGILGVWMRFVRGKSAEGLSKKVIETGSAANSSHKPLESHGLPESLDGNGVLPLPHELPPDPKSAALPRVSSTPLLHAIAPPIISSSPSSMDTLVDKSNGEPPKALSSPEEADESDNDNNDAENEQEGALPTTPGKRKGRRGKRGKKKKVSITLPAAANGELLEDEVATSSDKDKSADPKDKVGVEGGVQPPPPPPLQAPMSGVDTEAIKSKEVAQGPSLIVSDVVLGFGSHGTVVFRGSLQGRAVAVKRLLIDFVTLASREVSILQESDDHPNVIRYYYQESSGGFLYIALELCPASLADVVETPDRDHCREIAMTFDPKRALRQITSGLKHLHALKLVHRDIKPQNILVSPVKGATSSGRGGGNWRMLISDFGLCKKLDVDQTSFLPTAHGAMAAGTVGWRAPEILSGEVKLNELGNDDQSMSSRGSVATPTSSTVGGSSSGGTASGKRTRLTKSVDIFALGCLYYYTLTNGGHPFGDRFEREVNIMKNQKNLEGLERFGEEGAEAVNLIEKMLDPEAKERPDTTKCLLHPFFWDPGRRLNFLQDASDRFEIMCRDPKDSDLLTLETDAFAIVGNDWHSRLDKIFIENLGKFRKYDGRSVQDLLRALRNKKHHYQDLPDNVKRHLGPMPEGFLTYFTRRYPRLFLHVHSVISETGLHDESMFRSYFELADQ